MRTLHNLISKQELLKEMIESREGLNKNTDKNLNKYNNNNENENKSDQRGNGNENVNTEVSWLKIGIRLLSAVIGISLLILSFFAPGVVLPFLTNLLPISTFTAKITLAVVGFGLAVVGGHYRCVVL